MARVVAMRAPGACPATSVSVDDDVGKTIDALASIGGRDAGAAKLSTTRGEGESQSKARRSDAFALDLRAWTFEATTQAVRALGACARDASGELAVPFRDAFERFCARNSSVQAPRGAAWRLHRCGEWRFDLRALYESVKRRGGHDAIDGNIAWREVAESIGAHGRGCRAGYAARRAHAAWLRAYERETRVEEETARAREYVANARALTEEDKQIIDALVGLEFGASAPPPKRDEVENVRNHRAISAHPTARGFEGARSTNDRARRTTARVLDDGARERGLTLFLRRSFSHRAQGLDHIARQLGDGHEGDATCDVCGAPGDEDAMILCDGCDRGCARCENEREWMTREIFYVRSRGGKGRGGAGTRARGAAIGRGRRLRKRALG